MGQVFKRSLGKVGCKTIKTYNLGVVPKLRFLKINHYRSVSYNLEYFVAVTQFKELKKNIKHSFFTWQANDYPPYNLGPLPEVKSFYQP